MKTSELEQKALKLIADNVMDNQLQHERNKTLINNLVIFLDTEFLQHMSTEEKLDLLKEEIGFTDEEIESLDIKESLGDHKDSNIREYVD